MPNNSIKDRHQMSLQYALNVLEQTQYRNCMDAIYLFGSYARGENKYNSDVDILIQYNDRFTVETGRSMRIAANPDDYRLPEVELKFVQGEEWKKKEDQFSRNLRKDAVKLWERK